MDLLGLITGLPAEAVHIPWDGPEVESLQDGGVHDDLRVGPLALLDWLPNVPGWQLQRLAQRKQNETPE